MSDRSVRDDGAVDLHPLLKRAHDVAVDRSGDYGDWRSTALDFDRDDAAAYPRAMVRAKLARDPDLTREDTLVDLVNYLGMLFEVNVLEVEDLRSVDGPTPTIVIRDEASAIRFGDLVDAAIRTIRISGREPNRIRIDGEDIVPRGFPTVRYYEQAPTIGDVVVNPDDWTAAKRIADRGLGYLWGCSASENPRTWFGIPIEHGPRPE